MTGDAELDPRGRVLPRDEAVERYGPGRTTRLVFTNGCFDLLHRGHVALLARARSLGDELVVGLNSDRSVRRLKGPGRPLTPAEDRALLLASLRFVDAVTPFDEPTPLALVRALRPDVLVKGADYRREEVVGADEVEGWGGRVVLVPLVEARSTSALVDRLRGGTEEEGDLTARGGDSRPPGRRRRR